MPMDYSIDPVTLEEAKFWYNLDRIQRQNYNEKPSEQTEDYVMRKPKMILFDAGRTLLDYTSIDTLKGVKAIFPYITYNPQSLSAEDIDRGTNDIFSHFDKIRDQHYELSEQTILRLCYNLMGLEFSIPLNEIEQLIWIAYSDKVPTIHVGEVLDQITQMGIETAVVSNLNFSGDLLSKTLQTLFPNHQFQFVIVSSDYGIRKPHPYLFQAGIAKSGFEPQEIWYVGDQLVADAEGSCNVGMVPILFQHSNNHYSYLPEDLITIQDFRELLPLIHSAEE